jgi:prophage antirepressor
LPIVKKFYKEVFQYMDNNKLDTITNLFEGKEIRSIWDSEKEDYFFSVVDVISALTDSSIPRNYWSDLKRKLKNEGSQLHENIVQLKMKSQKDGKNYLTDTLDTKGILRLIESIPSKNAEPFKLWLAKLGNERIDELFNPELAISRAVNYYRSKGYDDKWIKSRMTGIVDRFKLTDVWKGNGITKNYEYGILTNEIYQAWSGMKASEYKKLKGLRKESLRDNMTDVEVVLTDLGEVATRELAKKHKPYGLEQNRKIAKKGGNIAKITRDNLEKELGESVITSKNALNYKYVDDEKLIEDRKSRKKK